MRFASQEFFGKLKEAILNDNGDDSIYTELYEVLLHDTRYRIIRNVGFQEWEDVFQEVVWAVIRQLPRYLMNSENMHESQRQSWLNLIVDRKSASWLEKINEMNKQKKNKKKQDDVKVSKQQVGRALSLDMLQELNEKRSHRLNWHTSLIRRRIQRHSCWNRRSVMNFWTNCMSCIPSIPHRIN